MPRPDADRAAALRVRPGAPGDVAFVLSCIRALAEFEKLTHELRADEGALRDHLFGEQRYAELLIGETGGAPVGYALFFSTYSTFLTRPGLFLEDLFVLPEHRGQGMARLLLTELARLAVERGCGRVEWSVLAWNRKAIDFYDSLGARPVRGWTPYRLTGASLVALAGGDADEV